MKLIKHFDFQNMDHLPKTDWNIEVGEKWANKELQHYVSDQKNLTFDQGLVINATLKNGIYESARINTKGKFAFKYGRIDIVAKVPKGKGTWPAVWMMSNDSRYGHWPKSGEIDILEHVGNELDDIYLCIHTEAYNHTKKEQYFEKVHIDHLSDDFHTFSLVWDESSLTYLIDDKQYAYYEKGENGKDASHKGWPFDHEYYLIINLAIGGMLGGNVDDTCFPQQFIVKDVKVYQ